MDALRFELEKSRRLLALQAAEMDALREEAAAQAAQASIEAGEQEHDSGTLRTALDMALRTAAASQQEASAAQAACEEAAEKLARIGEWLASVQNLGTPEDGLPDATAPQPLLFDATVFDAVPDVSGDDSNETLPQPDWPSLRAVMDDASAAPDEPNAANS